MKFARYFVVTFAAGAGLMGQTAMPLPPEGGSGKAVIMLRQGAGQIGPMADRVYYFQAEMSFDGKVVKNAPYSADAVTDTTQVLQDGTQIHRTVKATIYRDSQGRTRREQTLPGIGPFSSGAEPFVTVFLNDPVAGVNYVLDPKTRTARKMPTPPNAGPGMVQHFAMGGGGAGGEAGVMTGGAAGAGAGVVTGPGPGGPMFTEKLDPPKSEPLGTRNIEGINAQGTRTTMTIPVGQIGNDRPIQIVSERWYSNELQTVISSTRNDPMMGQTVYRLTNINRSEPPATLFQVPPDYTVKEGPFKMMLRAPAK